MRLILRSIKMTQTRTNRWAMAAFYAVCAACLTLLTGCASTPLSEIKPGASTEADVRARLGEPGRIWPAAGSAPAGSRVFEYSRQPYGHTAYMVDIGADGKVTALRQVLTAENFKNVAVGMSPEAVLRLLGKPMAVTHYPRKEETYYDWRYLDGRQWDDSKIFYAVFDKNRQVVSTGSIRDPDLDPKVDPFVFMRPMQRQWQPQKIRGSHV
jgi:hypothetical protein